MSYESFDQISLPTPLNTTYRYDPQSNTWTELLHMPIARVGAATPAPRLPNGDFFLAGGYGRIFSGPAQNHPGFERETLLFSPADNTWQAGPVLPCERQVNASSPTSAGPEPMVAAPAVIWNDLVVLISGEVRPATRTPAVVAIPLLEIQ